MVAADAQHTAFDGKWGTGDVVVPTFGKSHIEWAGPRIAAA